jgi:hypothetical protein
MLWPTSGEQINERKYMDTENNESNWNYPVDLIEAAWGLIANAAGGDWNEADKLSPGWKRAAEEWRDAYHKTLEDSK